MATNPTLTTEALESILRGLSALFKATRFYPREHPALKAAVEQLVEQLRGGLENGEPLLLTIHREGFSRNATPLQFRNPALKTFATQLFARQVQTLTILPDLNARDLQTFARCLSQEPAEIQLQGGAQSLLQQGGVSTLWVNELDLSKIYAQKGEREQGDPESATPEAENTPLSTDGQQGADAAHPEEQTLERILRDMIRTESDQHFRLLAKELNPVLQQNLTEAGRPLVLRTLLFLCQTATDRQPSMVRRQTAKEKLAQLNREDILLFLVQSLCHKNLPSTSHDQLFALFNCFAGKIERQLMRQLAEEQDAQYRKILGAALIRLGDFAIPVLIESLKDSRWFVVRNVIFILGEIRTQQPVTALTPLLSHEDLRVRRETIRTLTKIGGQNAEESLLQMLNCDEQELRRQAILSLGALKSTAAVPFLLTLATQKDRKGRHLEERKEAITALGQIGANTAVAPLQSLLRRRHWFASTPVELRTAAALALGTIGSPDALIALQLASGDRSEAVARAARTAIQRIEKTAPYAS